MSKITHSEIRMYKMGTGDCFAIKIFSGSKVKLKMLIDAGTWSGPKERIKPYIDDLISYLGSQIDILIVTHEHKDHVHAFDVCREVFKTIKVSEIWLGWTENDRNPKVKEWKEEYGQKKRALGIAAKELAKVTSDKQYIKQFEGNKNANRAMGARKAFSSVVNAFADLHLSLDENNMYKGGLAGMEVVKNDIKNDEIKYLRPGEIISNVRSLVGVNVYVLGPPEIYENVKRETGGKGESYSHNKDIRESNAFGLAINSMYGNNHLDKLLPFDENYIGSGRNAVGKEYTMEDKDWRRIDFDWLFSAGSFALRMNSLTNNLSLAIAIEFEECGKVLLFPGDAEFGSWSSWHSINWNQKRKNLQVNPVKEVQKHLTEDLLNRTVFYKVAHHLSHNGTAKELGLEMMNHPDLSAMASLDFNVISPGWKNTMPNLALVKDLLYRTKGRLMVMNDKEIYFDFNREVPLQGIIKEAQSRMTSSEKENFKNNFEDREGQLYMQYKVNLK